MSDPPYIALLRALSQEGVRFAIAGGLAVVLHGVPRMTFDLDLVADPSDENMLHLSRVLAAGGYKPRIPEPLERLADAAVRADWARHRHMRALSLYHPGRPMEEVDVLLEPPAPWREVERKLRHATLYGVQVPVLGKETLIAMKRSAGREQDLADADALEALGED